MRKDVKQCKLGAELFYSTRENLTMFSDLNVEKTKELVFSLRCHSQTFQQRVL